MATFQQARTVDRRETEDWSEPPPPGRGSDYAELSRRVKRAGLLDRRPAYYAAKTALTIVVLGAGWVAFLLLGNSWWQLATAVLLASEPVNLGETCQSGVC